MYPMFADWTFVVLIPALLLTFYAQFRVKSAFAKYSRVNAARGIDAESVARLLLDRHRLNGVRIERVRGELTDHYDPRTKVLRLSDSVGGCSSIAAIGVAAHEVGHAIQDGTGYSPLRVRNMLVPVANLGSNGAMILFVIGLIMGLGPLMNLGIVFFAGAVLFHIITLPVEFDASSRALKLLSSTGVLSARETDGARSVLNAAALTYVAAALMAIANLLRLVIMARGRRD
ncbi:MAG: zinc metallopeptidase [Synergistaceae bacterium]|nr:zinc metallopeptidase [Synergistaceae bacterium]